MAVMYCIICILRSPIDLDTHTCLLMSVWSDKVSFVKLYVEIYSPLFMSNITTNE